MATETNLWGDLSKLSQMSSPHSILHQQCVTLSDFTSKQLAGQIQSTIAPNGTHLLELHIAAPSLNNLTIPLLTVEHDFDQYPLECRSAGKTHFCDNEAVYIETLAQIFQSEPTRKILSSLLVQIQLETGDDNNQASSQQLPPTTDQEKKNSDTPTNSELESETSPPTSSGDHLSLYKSGQQLTLKNISELNAESKQVISSIGPPKLIFIRLADEEGISISFRARNDKEYEVYLPNDTTAVDIMSEYFTIQNTNSTTSMVIDKHYKTLFPKDLI